MSILPPFLLLWDKPEAWSSVADCSVRFCSREKIKINLLHQNQVKEVRAKIVQYIDFFKHSLWSDNELLVAEIQGKNEGHRLRFRDKACEKCSDFEKTAHKTQYGFKGFSYKY